MVHLATYRYNLTKVTRFWKTPGIRQKPVQMGGTIMKNWSKWNIWQKAVIVVMMLLLAYEIVTTAQALIRFFK